MVSLRTISLVNLVILGLLVTQLLAADHMLIPLKANCSSSQFQCTNGGCIPLGDVCDCLESCWDGSDEKDCNDMLGSGNVHARITYPHYCPSGECIFHSDICSRRWSPFGRTDCNDRSDEENCSDVAPCSPLQFECSNGKCINPTKQCDGFDACGDASDEINCFGKCNQFECTNGKCIYEKKCDCNDDCGDGSDENNCAGRTFHCPNGTCLLNSDVCNCEDDCGDGSDEENCDGRTFECSNGTCILSSKICDCEDDCGDGADEKNCENDCRKTNEDDFRFWCNHSDKHILGKYLNDGFDDCGDGSDENYCSAEPFHCDIEGCFQNSTICENDYGCANRSDKENCIGSCSEFQCPGGGPCIHENKVCDCNDDCEDGADENNCKGLYIKSKKDTSSHMQWNVSRFHCDDGKCLTESSIFFLCSGHPHCSDWTDQMECFGDCDGFQCPSGRCIPTWFQCDGINDCGDLTDEKNCPDVACGEHQFRCASGQCVSKRDCDFDGSLAHFSQCRDGSDQEHCELREDLRCGDGHYQVRPSVNRAKCNPFGKYPCCSDKGWCGNSEDHCACPDCIDYRVCTNGSSYQLNNGLSICTCVNGKYECKDQECIDHSAKILDDGCNYCICIKGRYENCTERTCNSTHPDNNGSTHPDDKGSYHQENQGSTHPDNNGSTHPDDKGSYHQ